MSQLYLVASLPGCNDMRGGGLFLVDAEKRGNIASYFENKDDNGNCNYSIYTFPELKKVTKADVTIEIEQ